MSHYLGSVPDTERAADWRDQAACRETGPDGKPRHDAELWFPVGTTGPALLQTEEAKRICASCPSMDACLSWALDSHIEFGVFGGLSEDERRARKRRTARGTGSPRPARADMLEFTRTGTLEEACRELYDRYTEMRDGHVVWVAERTQVKIANRERTYGRICFQAAHGRWPNGPVQRSCGVRQCVAPGCLTDTTIRAGISRCGSRTGYEQHLKRGEEACGPCKAANAAANRSLRTGSTTKAAV